MAPILELRKLVKHFPGQRAVAGHLAFHSARQFLLAARPIGLRQDHHPAPDRRLRRAHLRRRPAQRRNRQPAQALRAQRQHRLPELRPLPASHRARQRRVRPQAPPRHRYRPPRARSPRTGRPHRQGRRAVPRSSPAASASAWPSPAPWSCSPTSCCSTSPSPRSIPNCASRCASN